MKNENIFVGAQHAVPLRIPFPDRPTALYKFWKGGPGLELLCYTPEEFSHKKETIGLVADALKEGKDLLINAPDSYLLNPVSRLLSTVC